MSEKKIIKHVDITRMHGIVLLCTEIKEDMQRKSEQYQLVELF